MVDQLLSSLSLTFGNLCQIVSSRLEALRTLLVQIRCVSLKLKLLSELFPCLLVLFEHLVAQLAQLVTVQGFHFSLCVEVFLSDASQ